MGRKNPENPDNAINDLIEALLAVGGEEEFYEIRLLLDKFAAMVKPELIDRIVREWVVKIGYGNLPGHPVNVISALAYCKNAELITNVRLAWRKDRKELMTAVFFHELFDDLVRVDATSQAVCVSLEIVFCGDKRATTGMIFDAWPADHKVASSKDDAGIIGGVVRFFAGAKQWSQLATLSEQPMDADDSRFVFDVLCRNGQVAMALTWQKNNNSSILSFGATNFKALTQAVKQRKKK